MPKRPSPAPGESEVPIARLLAMAFRALIDELHLRLRERGHADVKTSYGFVLLAVRSRPKTVNEVAELMGVSKQAASKLCEGMAAASYLRSAKNPDDARSKLFYATASGESLLETVEGIYTDLEAEWGAVIGECRVAALRRDLERVLREGHGGELPAIKPTW